VLTGQVFPLKKESVEYPVSGSGDVIVEGLDPDVSYNYIVRAVSVTASGFSVPGTFRTLPVEKTEAVKIKMSANIILARDGRFYDGENIFTFIGAADPLIRNESRGEIDRLMSEYSKIGLKVLRIGCSGEAESMDKLDADKGKDFFRIGPDYFNENMYKKIDYVIDSASRHGMRVVMTAAENGWAGGGIKVIAGWAGTGSDGFWDNADAKKYYQQSICKFVTRKNTVSGKMYRDDPAIFAYELCDSIDAGEDSDKNRKMNWVREMAGYFRSIDPNHMLTTGMAGIQGVHSSLDGAQGIDFSSFQVQNDAKNGDEILARIRAFVNDGHNICKKPVVLERLGCTEDAVGYGRTKLFDSALRVFYDAGGDGANVCAFAGYDGAGKREDDRFKDVEYTNVFVKYANVADKNGY
jgi:endo-1,4-beta-mannosidase